MFGLPAVSITIFLPIISAFFIMITKKQDQQNIKFVALWGSFFTFAIALFLLFEFDFNTPGISNLNEFNWVYAHKIAYRVGLDKFSVFFINLISLLSFLSIFWLFKKNIPKAKHFFMSLLIFESFSLGAFCANDIFLLFVFMEASLIPLYVMLLCWDKEKNTEAILQLVIYTVVSAILILIAIIMIYTELQTSNLSEIYKLGVKNESVFWLILIGIAIKMPIWPFYHWLPNVHVKSPTVCSVLLASIVLKFSTLLIVRFIDPIFLKTLFHYKYFIFNFSILSMLFATASLLFQDDLKRFFAYFSIIHMNMYLLILLSGTDKKYFIFSVIYHSIIMTILFFAADIIKTMYKTRLISELRQLTTHFTKIKHFMLFCIICLIGIPFSWGFVSEILSIYSCSKISIYYAYITGGVILISSMYAFYVYNSAFGNSKTVNSSASDEFYISNIYKKTTLFALFFLIILIGIIPGIILNRL